MRVPAPSPYGARGLTTTHGLLAGLRMSRNEAQLTQAIAGVAAGDGCFAAAFVELVLGTAARDPRHTAAVDALRPVPRSLECAAEHALRGSDDSALGRIDLRFDAADFTLLIENKLHARVADDQLHRYRTALALLPAGRAGLLAITRNLPSRAETEVQGAGWLGAIRWSQIVGQLRLLPVADDEIRRQWPLLVDVLDAQGDLGMTSVDPDLVRAWARYLQGRDVLRDLMDAIREPAEDIIGTALAERYPALGPADRLCALLTHGKRGLVAVKTEQRFVWTGYRIPARERADPVVALQFWMEDGVAHFGVRADPYRAHERLRRREGQLIAAATELRRGGFEDDGGAWWSKHPAEEFIEHDDVPARLLELVVGDVTMLVRSDLLAGDVSRFGGGTRRTRARG